LQHGTQRGRTYETVAIKFNCSLFYIDTDAMTGFYNVSDADGNRKMLSERATALSIARTF
jgi:hypothetical protein